MSRRHLIIIAAVGLVAILAAACASAPTEQQAPNTPRPTRAPTDTPEPLLDEPVDFAGMLEEIDYSNFDDPTKIDNPWLPVIPGMQYIYEGVTEEAGIVTEHQVIITVTDLVKEIDGVMTVVTWDEDYSGGELVETELAFYAQDNDGNVWRMGEYPEVYEREKLIEAPAWISGLKGAQAGIMMAADPGARDGSYSQGWGPAVGFTDRWQVDMVEQETCVPADCYTGVLITAEYSEEEPDAIQLKYYAEGIGNVQVGWRGLDATREVLELVEVVEMDADEMAAAREAALALEARAYEQSKEVYDQTSPSYIDEDVEASSGMEDEAEADEDAMAEMEEPVKVWENFDPDAFDDPTTVDNEWLPLAPGTQLIFEGVTVEEGEEIPHRIEFTVTELTKEIDGTETVVIYVIDISDDELIEAEIAFYGQDNDGNVWYFGEYPEEYEDGEIVENPAWLHGQEGAMAGIKMWADPQLGTPPYFQGWGPEVEWTDYGQVDAVDEETCVEYDCFEGVLVIAESSLEEEDAYQLKYYAAAIGNIQVGFRGADATQEELELIEIVELDAEALAEIHELALALEESAYENAASVFGGTSPLQGP
ncbi:MAG: hypothetical protein JSV69_02485 [Chloroflexota bacterium]|nr:MAG: hypothetical protein JSV69_02485 [Chloroflexota bacterium]